MSQKQILYLPSHTNQGLAIEFAILALGQGSHASAEKELLYKILVSYLP